MTEGQPIQLYRLDDVRGSGDTGHFNMRNRLQESASKFTCEICGGDPQRCETETRSDSSKPGAIEFDPTER